MLNPKQWTPLIWRNILIYAVGMVFVFIAGGLDVGVLRSFDEISTLTNSLVVQGSRMNGFESNETATNLEGICSSILRIHKGGKDPHYSSIGETPLDRLSEKEIDMASMQNVCQNALRLATAAVAFSLLSLGFLTPRVVSQLVAYTKSTYEFVCDERTTDVEFWRRLCATLLHMGVFFLSTGLLLCSSNSFFVSGTVHDHGHDDDDDWRRDCTFFLIAQFAFVAGFLQTLFLQTTPHVIAVWPLGCRDAWLVAKYSFLRLFADMSLFGLEFLIVFIAYPSLLLSITAVFSEHDVAMIVAGSSLAALNVRAFEPRDSSYLLLGMTSTLATEELSWAASEATHLAAEDGANYNTCIANSTESSIVASTIPGTAEGEGDPALDQESLSLPAAEASRMMMASFDFYSTESMTPYFVRLDAATLGLLRFAFEVLLVVALVAMMVSIRAVPLLYQYYNYSHHNTMSLVTRVVAAAFLALACCFVGFLVGQRGVFGWHEKKKAYVDRRMDVIVSVEWKSSHSSSNSSSLLSREESLSSGLLSREESLSSGIDNDDCSLC